jgi:hypothetical protein
MTYLLDAIADQRSTYQGITWEHFKLIEQGFSQAPGVRLFYYRGALEIVAVSPEHYWILNSSLFDRIRCSV